MLSLIVARRGLLSIVVCELLVAVASCIVEHRFFSSCDPRALLLHGMFSLPGSGIEPVSPALVGGFLSAVPPGKSQIYALSLFFELLYYLFGYARVLVVAPRNLQSSLWLEGLWHIGSSSRPGIELGPPAWGAWSLRLWTTREVPRFTLFPPTPHCLSTIDHGAAQGSEAV